MTHESPQPLDVATTLRTQIEKLRLLATLKPQDLFYAQAAEQLVGIVTGLESRGAAGAGIPQENSGFPDPPSQG